MFTPLFAGSLGSGISQTLNQQLTQQAINEAFLNNVSLNNRVTSELDLLDQFAQGRSAGLSPNQAFFNISQNALNPNVATAGFGQFAGLTQAQAPFALGAALQGNTGFFNQIAAPTGVSPLQGSLTPQAILPTAAAIGVPGALGGIAQNAQNDASLQAANQLQQVIAQITGAATSANQQRGFLETSQRLNLAGDALGRPANSSFFSSADDISFPSFDFGSPSTGANGFRGLF